MINKDEFKLLLALLNTVDKHGLEIFNSLKEKLNRVDSLDFSFINEILSKQGGARVHSKPSYEIKTNEILRKMDDDKKRVIINLIKLIKDKSVIKNLSDFSIFLNKNGIHNKRTTSWGDGIYKIVSACFDEDIQFVNNLSDNFVNSGGDDRTLERWSEIILKPKDINNKP